MALITKNFVLLVTVISFLSSCKDLSPEEASIEKVESAVPTVTKIYQAAQIGSDVQMNIEGVNLNDSLHFEATINGKKVKLAAIETQKNGKNASFLIPSSVFQEASEAMMNLMISSAHAEDSADFTVKIKIQGNSSQEMSLKEIKKILRTDIEAEIRKHLLAEIIKEIKSDAKLQALLKGDIGEKGERGEPGEAGTIGPVGLVGEQGKSGEQGHAGEAGPTGMAGETGEPGERGTTGPQGIRGIAGAGVSNSTYTKAVLIDKDGNKLRWPAFAPNGVAAGKYLLENGVVGDLNWETGKFSLPSLKTNTGLHQVFFIEENCQGAPYAKVTQVLKNRLYTMSTWVTAETNAIVAAMASKVVRPADEIQNHHIRSQFEIGSSCYPNSSLLTFDMHEIILTEETVPDYSHLAPLDIVLE